MIRIAQVIADLFDVVDSLNVVGRRLNQALISCTPDDPNAEMIQASIVAIQSANLKTLDDIRLLSSLKNEVTL